MFCVKHINGDGIRHRVDRANNISYVCMTVIGSFMCSKLIVFNKLFVP
jgi:hypothetical protein